MSGVPHDFAALAARHGLTVEDLAALLRETDQVRGLLGPEDVEAGLQQVLRVYIEVLASTAERITNPVERHVVDRFLTLAMETLAGQLEAAPLVPN